MKSNIELEPGYLQVLDVFNCRFDVVGQNVIRQVVSAPKKDSISLLQQNASKSINNCLNMIIYSCLETSGGQSSNLNLNAVHFFQHQC